MDESRAIKVNLEYQKKGLVFGVMLVASLGLVICVIIASTLPPNILSETNFAYPMCTSASQISCFHFNVSQNFVNFSLSLHRPNQFFYLEANFDSKQDVSADLGYNLLIKSPEGNNSATITQRNKTFTVQCTDGECESVVMFYVPYIDHDDYNVQILISGKIPVTGIEFNVKYVDAGFTRFWSGTKSFFLAVSALAGLGTVYALCRVKFGFWSTESKLNAMMIFSLFLFNEPLLGETLVELTPGWSGLSVFCNLQFAAMLMVYWFQVLHLDFDLNWWSWSSILETVLVFVFFVLMCVVYMFTTVQLKYEPAFSWKTDLPTAQERIFIAALSILILISIWMISLLSRSFLRFNQETLRQKIMLILTYLMIFCTFILIGVGAFQPLPRSGVLLLITISLYNIYFITLSWLYSPSLISYKSYFEALERIDSNQESEIKNQNFNSEPEEHLENNKI